MPSRELIPEPERLLAQVEWVRALAQRLVRDPELALDLSQTTLLAALRRAPEGSESPRRLRAWLARVLANSVREERRGAAHRGAREAQAVRSDEASPTDEVVERAATHRAVVEAVLGLAEPYRATVLLRYFDGLSVAQIAERSDVNEVAVRKRLSRAVAMLRARLEPDDEGASRAWSFALMQLAAGGASSSVPISTSIGVALASKSLLALCAALLAIVAGLAWYRAEARPALPSVGLHASVAEVASAAPTAAVAPAETRVALGVAGRAAELVVLAAATGAPLAGAELQVVEAATREALVARLAQHWTALGIAAQAERWLALEGEEAVPADPAAPERAPFVPLEIGRAGESDASGRVDLQALRAAVGEAAGVVVTHPEGAPVFVPRAWLMRERDAAHGLALPAPATVSVRVIDATNGAAVAGAFLRTELETGMDPEAPGPLLDPLHWHGPSDADGRIVLAGLSAGTQLWLTPFGDFSTRPATHRVDPSAPECELRVWRVGGLRGRVVRADGSPAAGVAVTWRGPHAMATTGLYVELRSDERGEFHAEDLVVCRGRLSLRPVSSAAHALPDAVVELVPGEVVDVGELVLPEQVELSGRLLFPSDFEPGSFHLQIWQAGAERWDGGVAADGRFAFQVESGHHELVVWSTGGGRGWYRSVLARRTVEAPASGVEIDLRGVLCTLRASLPAGFPDMTADIRLRAAPDPAAPAFTTLVTHVQAVRVMNETFEIELLPPDEFELVLDFGELGTWRRANVVLEPGAVLDLGELELAGGVLEGRVTDAHGAPIAGARVQLAAPALSGGTTVTSDGPRRDVTTEPDGSYRLRMLDARTWTAWATHPELGASVVTSIGIENGASATHDFELAAPCFLRGHVTRGGAPVTDARVRCHEARANDQLLVQPGTTEARVDANGAYELGPLLPGEHGLELRAGAVAMHRILTLAPGASARADFELEDTLRRVQLMAEGEPLEHIEWVNSLCIDEQSPHFGATRTGRLRGVGLVEVELPPARVALLMQLGRHQPGRPVHVFLDGAELEDGSTVALPDGVLELLLGPEFQAGERPSLHVFGPPGWPLSEDEARGLFHPAEHTPDRVRFPCLTPGTRCLIVGRDAAGAPRERFVTYVGPGVQVEAWD